MKNRRKQDHVREHPTRDYYDRTSRLNEGERVRSAAMKFPSPRRLVALRLEEDSLASIKELAARKGLNYSTLMRMWITERLNKEKGS